MKKIILPILIFAIISLHAENWKDEYDEFSHERRVSFSLLITGPEGAERADITSVTRIQFVTVIMDNPDDPVKSFTMIDIFNAEKSNDLQLNDVDLSFGGTVFDGLMKDESINEWKDIGSGDFASVVHMASLNDIFYSMVEPPFRAKLYFNESLSKIIQVDNDTQRELIEFCNYMINNDYIIIPENIKNSM